MGVLYKLRKRTGRRISLTLLKLKYGNPDYIFSFKGGLGDELLSTIPIKHLAEKGKNIWFVTNHPDLFRHNPHISFVLSDELTKKLKLEVTNLVYIAPPIDGKEVVPEDHIIKLLCNKAGINELSINPKPTLNLTESEIEEAA